MSALGVASRGERYKRRIDREIDNKVHDVCTLVCVRVHSSSAPHILDRFLIDAARPRIRDCNKTTDVRTHALSLTSRTGIVHFALARFPLYLSLPRSLALSRFFPYFLLPLSLTLPLRVAFRFGLCFAPRFESPSSYLLLSANYSEIGRERERERGDYTCARLWARQLF